MKKYLLKKHRLNMRLICFIIFNMIFFQSIGLANSHINHSYSDSIKTFDQSQIDKYFQVLQLNQESYRAWISQKEIAAWGAVVLFLSIIFVLINKIEELKKRRKTSTGFVLLFSLMFCLFIHQEYGSMNYAQGFRGAVNKTMYSTIINGRLPEYIDITDENKLAKSLEGKIQTAQKGLRHYCWCLKPFVPFIKIYSGICLHKHENISTVEVEESILYDIILILSFMIIALIWNFELKLRNFILKIYKRVREYLKM